MIQIETLHVENCRGIRELTLNLARRNFSIYGPNGTGKSGIVDAIEFVLTGSVTRLGGRGSGGISVRGHGPHVDYRDLPDKALVRIQVFAPSLNRSFSIERRVNAPTKPVITPDDDPQILELAARVRKTTAIADLATGATFMRIGYANRRATSATNDDSQATVNTGYFCFSSRSTSRAPWSNATIVSGRLAGS